MTHQSSYYFPKMKIKLHFIYLILLFAVLLSLVYQPLYKPDYLIINRSTSLHIFDNIITSTATESAFQSLQSIYSQTDIENEDPDSRITVLISPANFLLLMVCLFFSFIIVCLYLISKSSVSFRYLVDIPPPAAIQMA
jgi:hypothetical protein